MGCAGAPMRPRQLWMWPNARISVMGGEQAANVLLTVRLEGLRARGRDMNLEEQEGFKAPILEKYEAEGNPYYSTARLWDDGIIDPLDTRMTLALGIAAAECADSRDEVRGVSDVRESGRTWQLS